jgi:alkyl sulfatase BDS1-like metallo-beta-lactamase superfamily hydrolase
MADGNIVKPKAVLEGRMEIDGVQVFGSFKVFDSEGNWEFLLRKPLLTALHAIHEYTDSTITIENNGLSAVLRNQINVMTKTQNKASQKRTKDK